MVNTPLIISPQTENISDDTELTDGLDVTANVLSALGASGGFVDEFVGSTLDASIWEQSAGVTVANGVATIIGTNPAISTITGDRFLCSRLVGQTNYTPLSLTGSLLFKIKKVSALRHEIQLGTTYIQSTSSSPTTGDAILNFIEDGRLVFSSFTLPAGSVNVGDSILLRWTASEAITNSFAWLDLSIDDGNSWIRARYTTRFRGYAVISVRHPNIPVAFEMIEWTGFEKSGSATLPEADAYIAQSPATLASISTILVLLASAGAGGLLNYQIQRKSVEYPEWVDLDGNIGEWTDLGICDGSTPFDLSAIYKPLGTDQFRDQFVFSGSGLVAYPSVSGRTITWGSDVTAPSAPVITTAIATNESILTMLFANLLSDMYAVIFEANFNNSGSIPYSSRGIFETGYDYMRLRGNIGEVQQSGELNTLLMSIKGLAEGDVVTITAFARDDVGNVSAGTQKNITMSGAQYKMMFVEEIKSTLSSEVISGKLGCSDDN